jgi:hypothetical protein
MAFELGPTHKSVSAALGNKAFPVAHVIGGVYNHWKLWLNPDAPSGKTRVHLPINSHFNIEPPHDPKQRQCLWTFGMSGSGKSTILRSYARRYRQLWPRRPIVLISQLQEDETLDLLADEIGMRRLSIDSLVERPLELDELGKDGSLILFDDIDALDKETDLAVHDAITKIATMGRHALCSMIIASHTPTNGLKTRVILSEMHAFVCFSHGASPSAIDYLLERYAGLSKIQCRNARKLRSRWFMVSKMYPGYVIADGTSYLLHADEEAVKTH